MSPVGITGESSPSSPSPASSSAPVSTTEANSRWSLDVAVAESRPAAPTMAFSWLRSWCPKSTSSSGSSRARPADAPLVLVSSMVRLDEACGWGLWGRSEERIRQLDAVSAEVLQEHRPRACRRVVADCATIRGHAHLPEREHLLQDDLAVLHAEHLGDGDDLAGATAKALGLHDDVDGGCNLR